jgi:hypothetical protein
MSGVFQVARLGMEFHAACKPRPAADSALIDTRGGKNAQDKRSVSANAAPTPTLPSNSDEFFQFAKFFSHGPRASFN